MLVHLDSNRKEERAPSEDAFTQPTTEYTQVAPFPGPAEICILPRPGAARADTQKGAYFLEKVVKSWGKMKLTRRQYSQTAE